MRRALYPWLYLLAWLPYALSYYVIFRMVPAVEHPLRQVAYNILPALLLGALIVPWCRRLPWTLHRRPWFFPVQILSAVLYSLLWYGGIVVAGSLGQVLLSHRLLFGYFSSYALQWQMFSGLMVYGNIAGLTYLFQVQETLRREEARRSLAESLRTRAELAALRAQLNPHFLFNTLNSLAALAGPDQPRVLEALAQLAAMLRYTQEQAAGAEDEEGVSLRQELDFTGQYLALESLRLGQRLRVVREIAPAALGCRVPPLTLQPLVENSIRHGIAPRSGPGCLTLRAQVDAHSLHLVVEDDGLGCEQSSLNSATGLGLRTVRERLELFTEGAARVVIQTAPQGGFRTTLSLPAMGASQP